MDEKDQSADEVISDKTEQQIRLENAKKERIEAETKKAKQQSREKAREQRRDSAAKVPLKVKLIVAAVVAIVLFVFFGFILPNLLSDHKTHYASETELKEAVQIENLSAIEYVYCGIAEKPGRFLWMDNVEYRVKYEAHVKASYKMSDIQFVVDNEKRVATAYLPEAELGKITLDETKFGYLPERANANMSEVLALCREDAANDLNLEQVQEEARENLQNIIKALTLPLLGDKWQMEFKSLSEYEGGESNEAE